jgi:hypothetical protein
MTRSQQFAVAVAAILLQLAAAAPAAAASAAVKAACTADGCATTTAVIMSVRSCGSCNRGIERNVSTDGTPRERPHRPGYEAPAGSVIDG